MNIKELINVEEVKHISIHIEDFLLEYNDMVIDKTKDLITMMGITNMILEVDKNTLHIVLKRPGILIGKCGVLINSLSDYLKTKGYYFIINLHENNIDELWYSFYG